MLTSTTPKNKIKALHTHTNSSPSLYSKGSLDEFKVTPSSIVNLHTFTEINNYVPFPLPATPAEAEEQYFFSTSSAS